MIKKLLFGLWLQDTVSNNEQYLYIQHPNYQKIWSFNTHFPFFASYIRQLVSPAVVSQHIWTPFSTVLHIHLGNVLMEIFDAFIGDGFNYF